MKAWDLSVDTPLSFVLSWCLKERAVDRLLLSARLQEDGKGLESPEPGVTGLIESIFSNKVLLTKRVRRWPGTELVGHDGLIFLISFDSSLIEPMAQVGETLGHWRHGNNPCLPEDLCLFRVGDDWPVLVSVTHERDAWIISEGRPPFCSGEPFEFNPESLLIPAAAEGFVGA